MDPDSLGSGPRLLTLGRSRPPSVRLLGQSHLTMLPASIGSATPVMYLAASEHRKTTASETSSGSIQATPGRMLSDSNGSRTSSSVGLTRCGANSSKVESLITSGVRTVVGQTAL